MSSVLPIALWYGGLLAVVLASLCGLWALALIAIKRVTSLLPAGILVCGIVLAIAGSWAVTRATALNQENQLYKVHEPLMRFVAGSVDARSALEDVRAVARPTADLTAFQAEYESLEASLESLLQAEWQYHRRGPWDEHALLHKTTWDVTDLLVRHARWTKRAEALDCPMPVGPPALSDAVVRLGQRLQSQYVLADAIGEQFEGFDLQEGEAQPFGDAAVMKALAGMLGGMALLSGVAVLFVWRKRSWHAIDALVAAAAIVLVNLAGWLALGAGADQERARASLFAHAATVQRQTLGLSRRLKSLTLSPRGGTLLPRDSEEGIIAGYRDYTESLNGLAQLVRIWDRAVLTGTLDTGLLLPERIRTHDDLLNGIRDRTLTLYRQYSQLDRRLEDLSCRSEWFARSDGRALEDALVTLPRR